MPIKTASYRPTTPSSQSNHASRLGFYVPILLVLLGVPIAVFPSDDLFLLTSALVSAVALFSSAVLLLRSQTIRFSWLLGSAVLLGYGFGSFNTAVRFALDRSSVSSETNRLPDDLGYALAICLWVSAALFLAGNFEKPTRIDVRLIGRIDQRYLWPLIALEVVAVATGQLGYMGTSVQADNRVSVIGDLAMLVSNFLPAFTLFLYQASGRGRLKFLLVLAFLTEITCLIPQGRRALIYPLCTCLLALSLRGLKIKFGPKAIMALGALAFLLYAGNNFFLAMRFSRSMAGDKQMALTENASRAMGVLSGGYGTFDEGAAENLRDRTLILGYFSDLLAASATHEPLYGKDALFCAQMAIPTVMFPDKNKLRDIGAEEELANPQFGLPVEDDANSLLTSGLSDFGILGAFAYPLLVALGSSLFIRVVSKWLPEALKLIAILSTSQLMMQTEVAGQSYTAFFRDISLVILLLIPVYLLDSAVRNNRTKRISDHLAFGVAGRGSVVADWKIVAAPRIAETRNS